MELTYDGETNTLRLTPTLWVDGVAPAHSATLDAILDIGEGGRLIGVEFPADAAQLTHWQHDTAASPFVTHTDDGRAYIQITPGDAENVRSTSLQVIAESNVAGEILALAIPRRGDGYEITYPSGNQ